MKKGIKFLAAAILGFAAVACASPEKMAQMAENVTVKCDPAVLECVAGNIDATVSVTFPADYFNPKAIVEVTPVLVYEGGEAKMAPFTYQGEKIKDNYTVVSKDGATVTEKVHFQYVEGMEKSYLELRGVVSIKAKSITLPSRKVADGVNTTYMLVKEDGMVQYKADAYQSVLTQTKEGQIMYTINSADVNNKELKSSSVKDFQSALDEIKANDRETLKGTQIVAYASPDGGQELNTKLSDKRSKSAEKAFKTVTKGHETTTPEVKSVGQDWEGFQKLVNESNIEDKDLILRVLNMYSDPAVRESEIKNMSEVYTSLKSGVLPELRRARFIANVEYKNYTDEELAKMVEDNSDVLDEEALLHAASLTKSNDQKEALYKKAVDKFNSDRAQYNLGVLYLNEGKVNKAASAFDKVQASDADVQNAKGVVALRQGDYETAAKCFKASGSDVAKANQGVIDILSGNYDQAVADLKNAPGCPHNKTLAYILTDQLDAAKAAAKCKSEEVAYLKAIIAARQGDTDAYNTAIATASKNSDLAARATKDIEFAAYNK